MLRRQPTVDEEEDPLAPAGPAGGCGLCYGEQYKGAIGPRDAGTVAHNVIQAAMWKAYPDMIPRELVVKGRKERGEIDLARVVPPNRLEIGEIKPQDSIDTAIGDIDWYIKLLKQDKDWKGYDIKPLELKCPQPLDFPTLSPDPGCQTQKLSVANTKGLYFYFCEPSFKKLKAQGCKCTKRKREDKRPPPPPVAIPKDADKTKPRPKDDRPSKRVDGGDQKVPEHLLDLGENGKIIPEIAAAIIALGIAIGEIPSPLTIIEAIGAALGYGLARLLTALGFGIAAGLVEELSAHADPSKRGSKPGGKDPSDDYDWSKVDPTKKIPGGGKVDPKLPPKAGPPVYGPPAPPVQGPAPPPKPQATKPAPAKPPARKAPASKPPSKRSVGGRRKRTLTEWSIVEGLNPSRAWAGQEIIAWNNRQPPDTEFWVLRIDSIKKQGADDVVTFTSIYEGDKTGIYHGGNVFTATYTHGRPTEDKPSVALAVAERRDLPAEVHKVPATAVIVTWFLRLQERAAARRSGH